MEAWEEGSGVMVTQLREGGLAAASGLLCVGDVAVSINGVPCKTAPEAAKSLREKCLNFMLANFDAVTRTASFEEMGRTNVELVFEILKARNS